MSSRRPPPKPSRAPAPESNREGKKQGDYALPPVPVAPPSRRRFSSEPPTRQKNVAASVYQSLISVFDTMTPAERMEFVDVASLYASLEPSAKRDLAALMALYPTLAPAARGEVHDLVEQLAAKSTKRR